MTTGENVGKDGCIFGGGLQMGQCQYLGDARLHMSSKLLRGIAGVLSVMVVA